MLLAAPTHQSTDRRWPMPRSVKRRFQLLSLHLYGGGRAVLRFKCTMQQRVSNRSYAGAYVLERLPEDSPVLDFCNSYDTSGARESFLIDQDKRRRKLKRRMSSGCGRSELRKALAEELSRLAVAEGRAEDEQRLRLDAERRALAAERLLDVVAALLDMLVTAAVVTLVVFVGGFGALAPLYIVFVSWRCRDLLPRPQRQWRGVMAAAVTVACAACCVSMVVASAGFVSQAVAHAAFYPCVALLAARAALVTLTRVVRCVWLSCIVKNRIVGSVAERPQQRAPRLSAGVPRIARGIPLSSVLGRWSCPAP